MNVSKTNEVGLKAETDEIMVKRVIRKKKKCARDGCNNMIVDSRNKKFCMDPECVAKRDIASEEKKNYWKNGAIYDRSINVQIPKNRQLNGKTLAIRCSARGVKGRCTNISVVEYRLSQKTYPRYCEHHRNEYRRRLWEEKGI